MPQIGESVGTDEAFEGVCKPDPSFFMRADAVAGCSAGVFWYLPDGEGQRARYFVFHEQESLSANSQLERFNDWLATLPPNAPINLLRFSAGAKSPIMMSLWALGDRLTKRGWMAPGVGNPNLVQFNKNIDFYPFNDGEIRVDEMPVRDYVAKKGINRSSIS